ncbi:hypothetical protein [Micromonospora polyrhachis]|uniref:Uncharacterized protein n=1 Tax=Micromonospora polyrhachis TaxID=1282883 RepID=A0A7W7SQ51_9ACTN|nr:hypothetical protein [Micromonospora polyrhachis]MBB4958761.1 hypothetical protein [Micromonospora polyrhachis]
MQRITGQAWVGGSASAGFGVPGGWVGPGVVPGHGVPGGMLDQAGPGMPGAAGWLVGPGGVPGPAGGVADPGAPVPGPGRELAVDWPAPSHGSLPISSGGQNGSTSRCGTAGI